MERLVALLVGLMALAGCEPKAKEPSVLPGVGSVVFVKRAYMREDGSHDVTGGVGQVFDYDRDTPGRGSGLYVLTPPSPDGKLLTLATISEIAGDSDRRLCSQNLSHHSGAFVHGLVGCSRWEHLGPVNDVELFSMRPDCTQKRALAGQHEKPFNSIVRVREVGHGEFVGVATTRDGTIQAGSLVNVKVPDRAVNQTLGFYDETNARFESLTLSVPTDDKAPPTGVGRYRSPNLLPGTDKLVVSWADGDLNERNELAQTAPDFGMYLYDPKSGKRELLYDDPKMWDLYAMPVVERPEPPVLESVNDGAYDPDMPVTIGSIDVRDTSEQGSGGQFEGVPLKTALKQAQRVRVIEGLSPVRFSWPPRAWSGRAGPRCRSPTREWVTRQRAREPAHRQGEYQRGQVRGRR